MSTVLSQKILTAHKIHNCSAYYFVISEVISDIIGELTFKEKREIIRMKQQKGHIFPGQKYIMQANIFDGDFCIWKADLEMHKICIRLDLYEND